MNEITNDLFWRTSDRIGVRRREFLLRAVSTGAVVAGGPRYQTAAVLQTATSREPSRFRSPKVVNVSDNGRTVVVETTGAIFTLHRSNPGLIELTQKINSPRVLCQEWDTSFADLTINFHDQDDFISYVPVDIYLTDRGRGLGESYAPMAQVHELMSKEYFPALDRLKASVVKSH